VQGRRVQVALSLGCTDSGYHVAAVNRQYRTTPQKTPWPGRKPASGRRPCGCGDNPWPTKTPLIHGQQDQPRPKPGASSRPHCSFRHQVHRKLRLRHAVAVTGPSFSCAKQRPLSPRSSMRRSAAGRLDSRRGSRGGPIPWIRGCRCRGDCCREHARDPYAEGTTLCRVGRAADRSLRRWFSSLAPIAITSCRFISQGLGRCRDRP
jgi:hypothetical protein